MLTRQVSTACLQQSPRHALTHTVSVNHDYSISTLLRHYGSACILCLDDFFALCMPDGENEGSQPCMKRNRQTCLSVCLCFSDSSILHIDRTLENPEGIPLTHGLTIFLSDRQDAVLTHFTLQSQLNNNVRLLPCGQSRSADDECYNSGSLLESPI